MVRVSDGQGKGFVTVPWGEGLAFHVLPTDMFKTVSLRVAMRRGLKAADVSANACIPFVLRRGTQRHPDSRSIARFLEGLYGASFGADCDKIGETHVLEFSLDVVSDRYVPAETSLVRQGLEFLGDVVLRPRLEDGRFVASYVSREVDMLKRRIEGLINNKPQYALERLRQTMFADEPFGLYRYGTVEGLLALKPDALYDHYRRVVEESVIDVFVVGHVEPDQVEGWAREALPIPRGQVEPVGAPVVRQPQEVREVQEEEDVHQGVLAIGYRTPVRFPDDDYDALLVYNGILGGFPHSKLFINVREKASLAYFAASRLEGTKGVLVAFAGIDPQRYGQARAIVERQVDDMAAGRISDEELEATKKAIIHGLRTVTDSPHRLIDRHLLGLVNGRVRPLEETIAAIEGVSRDDVVRIAQGIVPDTVYFLTRASEDGGTAGSEAGSPEGGEGE